jgi:hypothetical protein
MDYQKLDDIMGYLLCDIYKFIVKLSNWMIL